MFFSLLPKGISSIKNGTLALKKVKIVQSSCLFDIQLKASHTIRMAATSQMAQKYWSDLYKMPLIHLISK